MAEMPCQDCPSQTFVHVEVKVNPLSPGAWLIPTTVIVLYFPVPTPFDHRTQFFRGVPRTGAWRNYANVPLPRPPTVLAEMTSAVAHWLRKTDENRILALLDLFWATHSEGACVEFFCGGMVPADKLS